MSTINFRLIKQLWMFLAVAEEMHFGRAANRLGMSQPPLTEQIKVLEQSLKVQLFNRSRRGTQLTPAGAAILPAVRQFASQMESLERVVREVVQGQTGVLKIGAITSAMLETIPPLLDALKNKHPNLTVFIKEIDSVDASVALNAGEIDIAFVRVDGEQSAGIETKALANDKLAVALPASHRLFDQEVVSIKEIAGDAFIMSSRSLSPVYFDRLVGICQNHGFSPRILHEVRSVASQVAYVGCGQGIALVPKSMDKVSPENVRIVELSEGIDVSTAVVAWKKDQYQPLVLSILEELKVDVLNV